MWTFSIQISHFQKKVSPYFFCFFGHFTLCWNTYCQYSMLTTVCNSLHSSNIGSLPNSGLFLLKESLSFLTFWVWKSSMKFCLWEKLSLPFSIELSEEFCFYPKQAFLFPKKYCLPDLLRQNKTAKILAKDLCILTLDEL